MDIEKEFAETVQKIADMTNLSADEVKEMIDNSESIDEVLEQAMRYMHYE